MRIKISDLFRTSFSWRRKRAPIIGMATLVVGLLLLTQAGDVVIPGNGNRALQNGSIVLGGLSNTAVGLRSTVLGGRDNYCKAENSAIVSGQFNTASIPSFYDPNIGESFIAGGSSNTLLRASSFIGGGQQNAINGAGLSGILSGTNVDVSGQGIIVLSGENIKVERNSSIGMFYGSDIELLGRQFVCFADDSRGGVPKVENISSIGVYYCRFANGYRFFTSPRLNVGASLSAGATSWSAISSREAKENFNAVDTSKILEEVCGMEMHRWNYKHDKETKYMGVMAEDMYDSFGYGHNRRTINTLVADGVAIAALQELSSRDERRKVTVEIQADKISTLKAKVEARKELIDNMKTRMAILENHISN